jgi:hypothetical protein
MPYIDQARRAALARAEQPATAGELNYAITRMLLEYAAARGMSYATINEVVGVIECVKQEFYRRAAAPYEDAKCVENGDVYR